MTEVQAQRDPEYFFSFRTFQVEDTLFRVPQYLIPLSNIQVQPLPDGTDSGDDLVVLGGDIKKDDFRQLLRAVYPRHYNTTESFDLAECQTVLRLSRIFGMEEIQAKAASNLKDGIFARDPVDALIYAKDNGFDDWIAPLIDKIVKRKRDLTENQLDKIGMSLAMRIARIQGAAHRDTQILAQNATNEIPQEAEPANLAKPGKKKKGRKAKK